MSSSLPKSQGHKWYRFNSIVTWRSHGWSHHSLMPIPSANVILRRDSFFNLYSYLTITRLRHFCYPKGSGLWHQTPPIRHQNLSPWGWGLSTRLVPPVSSVSGAMIGGTIVTKLPVIMWPWQNPLWLCDAKPHWCHSHIYHIWILTPVTALGTSLIWSDHSLSSDSCRWWSHSQEKHGIGHHQRCRGPRSEHEGHFELFWGHATGVKGCFESEFENLVIWKATHSAQPGHYLTTSHAILTWLARLGVNVTTLTVTVSCS